MATSLILHKRITTTLAKAKALRVYVEPILTKGKEDTTHSRRTVFSYLQDKDAVSILFRDIAAKIANRPGGYTRIIKMENRLGDNAEMALIELVDYNTVYSKDVAVIAKKSTRRRGGRGGTSKIDANIEMAFVEDRKETGVAKLSDNEKSENTVPDMSLLKYAPHFVAATDPKIDAFRAYKLLSLYEQTGEMPDDYDESERRLIDEYNLLNGSAKQDRLMELKGKYSKKA